MYEAYETSNPYFVGVSNGDVIFGVDVLLINRDTNQQEIITQRLKRAPAETLQNERGASGASLFNHWLALF